MSSSGTHQDETAEEELPLNSAADDSNANDVDKVVPGSVVVVTGGITMPTGVAVGVLVQPPTAHHRGAAATASTAAPRTTARLSHAHPSDPELAESYHEKAHVVVDDDDEAETATQKRSNRRMIQPMEIGHEEPASCEYEDDEHAALNISTSDDSALDDDDNDMEGLLPDVIPPPKRNKKNKNAGIRIKDPMCWSSQKIGNTTVFWPAMYHKSGFGMIGPHFLGPPCVLGLLWSASWYFIRHAWMHVGWMTALVCVGFTVVATFHLGNCCLRDPGIVRPLDVAPGQLRPPPPDRHHRWCDLCQAYQPPTGAHCPECNVCVAGYDHHCAWMGCCIGQCNYQPFLKFNMTWLVFLSYSIFWVSLLGPVFGSHHDAAAANHEPTVSSTTFDEDPAIFASDHDQGGGGGGGDNRFFFLRR